MDSLTFYMPFRTEPIDSASALAGPWIPWWIRVISSVAFTVCKARSFTSPATTSKSRQLELGRKMETEGAIRVYPQRIRKVVLTQCAGAASILLFKKAGTNSFLYNCFTTYSTCQLANMAS